MIDFTDLSKPLPVNDPARLQETMTTLVQILWGKPLVANVPISYLESTSETVSVKQLELQP